MSDSTAPTVSRAVFLSYAREDSAAARRIADALREIGVEVWFDQSELRGGDAWDQKIRKQIRDCALFVPIVSANTQERGEGYFRFEWKLAVERTHHMAEGIPFLAPVALDRSHEADALVPPEFMCVHWTRLTDGTPTQEFVGQIKRLLDAPRKSTAMRQAESAGPQFSAPPAKPQREEIPAAPLLPSRAPAAAPKAGRALRARSVGIAALTAVLLAGFGGWQVLQRKTALPPAFELAARRSAPPTPENSAAPTAQSEEKSVAVLAFADLSAAHDSEYFSDGIGEELINALGKVPGLKVPAGTSSFYFKGKSVPVPEIAKQLGVAYVIEGSVQRAGDKVKISARLSKAPDGFQVWTDSFTRDAKDVFAVEEEIAGLIARQLSLTLGASAATGRTSVNPEAFALYVQGRQLWGRRTEQDFVRAESMFTQALELEPNFVRAQVGRADARLFLAGRRGQVGTWDQCGARLLGEIAADLQRALALEPDLAEAHASMGNVHSQRAERAEALQELLTAVRLNPNYATGHQWLAIEYWRQGQLAEARAAVLAGVKADPLSSIVAAACSVVLQSAGDLPAALEQAERAVALQPDSWRAIGTKSSILFDLGRRDEALVLARSVVGHDATTQGLGRALFVLAAAGGAGEAEEAGRVSGPLAGLVELQGAAALGKWNDFFAHWSASNLPIDDVWYLSAPALDPIRADPRFLGLLKEVGLEEAHARFQAWRKAHPTEKPVAK